MEIGDTLAAIAERCGTTVSAFLDANPGLDDPNIIHPGQTLSVPGLESRSGTVGRAGEPQSYTIASGDTLSSIAERFGTTTAAILAANSGLDPRTLSVGRVIDLPRDGVPADRPDLAGAVASISPDQGMVGTEVRVRARGLPPSTPVVIGGGPPNSEFDVLKRTRTDRYGRVRATVTVPEHAGDDRAWVFAVRPEGPGPKAMSERFALVRDGRNDGKARDRGRMRVTGRLVKGGVECPALRGDDGRLYTLATRDLGRFKVGDRVEVIGKKAQVSFCQQGTTINVTDIRAPR